MKRSRARVGTTLLAAAAVSTTLAGGIAQAASAATTTTPPYENGSNAFEVGTLALYDANGGLVTGGNTADHPFASYAVASKTITAGDSTAQLTLCTPKEGVDPNNWNCDSLNAFTAYPVTAAGTPTDVSSATTPVSTVVKSDLSLSNIITEFPNTATDAYAGLYQLRLKTAHGSTIGADYETADIQVNASTGAYSVVYPTITVQPTTTSLTETPSGSQTVGRSVALTASISPSSAAGTVQFSVNGTPQGGAVAVSGGTATASFTPAAVGTAQVSAAFTPTDSSAFQASSTTASYDVTPSASGPGSYHPVAPLRVLDTRKNGLQPVPVNGTVTFRVEGATDANGNTVVPATGVGAALVNITAVQGNAPGYVTAYPTGQSRPTASNLNYGKGQTVANLVSVPVGSDGTVTLFNGGTSTVEVIADLQGYYEAGMATAAGAFTPVSPTRILDTRKAVGVATKTPISAGTVVPLQIEGVTDSHGTTVVPASGVGAVVFNLTATDVTAPSVVTAYPSGAATAPTASNVNVGRGQTVANLVTVPVGADGKVDLLLGGTNSQADLIADVAGYYLTGTPTAGGTLGSFTPVRILDTRKGVGASQGAVQAGSFVTLQIAGTHGIPASSFGAAVLNVTAVAGTGGGYVTAYPGGTTVPTASNLNFSGGSTTPVAVTVKIGSAGTIQLYVGGPKGVSVQLIADLSGYTLANA